MNQQAKISNEIALSQTERAVLLNWSRENCAKLISLLLGLHAGLLRLGRLLSPGNSAVHEHLEDSLLRHALGSGHGNDHAFGCKRAIQTSLQEVGLTVGANAHVIKTVVPAAQGPVAFDAQI